MNLLKFLMMNKGKALTHKEILKEVWGNAYMQESQYLRVHIGNIRSKINFDAIHTIPGVGYSIENIL